MPDVPASRPTPHRPAPRVTTSPPYDSESRNPPPDRGHLLTEQRNPNTTSLDATSVEECLALLSAEDATVPEAVARARPAIAAFIKDAEPKLRAGGRLIYCGAGTSGRLAVLDAAECPPTFQTPPSQVVAIIAGGDAALRRSSESKEDDRAGAHAEIDRLIVGARDVFLGVAAGGTTPYVLGAVEHARMRGAQTGLLVCAPIERPFYLDHLIVVETGSEPVTGSTRMKAGTATKLVLNQISTTLMVRLGKVYENLMVDLRATNDKLRDRAARIVMEVTTCTRDEAFETLDAADGAVKTAILMRLNNLDRHTAESRLAACEGKLRQALDDNAR